MLFIYLLIDWLIRSICFFPFQLQHGVLKDISKIPQQPPTLTFYIVHQGSQPEVLQHSFPILPHLQTQTRWGSLLVANTFQALSYAQGIQPPRHTCPFLCLTEHHPSWRAQLWSLLFSFLPEQSILCGRTLFPLHGTFHVPLVFVIWRKICYLNCQLS